MTKAYPRNQPAEVIARIAGTKMLTKSAIVKVLALGCTIEILDRYGNVSRIFEPGGVDRLPQMARRKLDGPGCKLAAWFR
jgi:hypothetical protein